jgi:hypothetical protein
MSQEQWDEWDSLSARARNILLHEAKCFTIWDIERSAAQHSTSVKAFLARQPGCGPITLTEIMTFIQESGSRIDVTCRTTPDGTFYYPVTDKAFHLMRPLLCIYYEPEDMDHKNFINAFPTLKLKEKANGPQ